MRRWMIALGALLAIGGGAMVAARAWLVAELAKHRDVLVLGVIGDVVALEWMLAIGWWMGIGLVVGGLGTIVAGMRMGREREPGFGVMVATVAVALLIAIPGAMFGVEMTRGRKAGDKTVGGGTEVSGCADGRREGFVDVARFPRIAGCVGTWAQRMSLRAGRTGAACGNDAACVSPADLCARGWHVCASADELRVVGIEDCMRAGPGRFRAAMSVSATSEGCEVADAMPCASKGLGAAPVCCGTGCVALGDCRDAVWIEATLVDPDAVCGAAAGGGVLCCRDAGADR